MHKFAEELKKRGGYVSVLLNNGGDFSPPDNPTEDGFEVRPSHPLGQQRDLAGCSMIISSYALFAPCDCSPFANHLHKVWCAPACT